jgi:hypothetical protein
MASYYFYGFPNQIPADFIRYMQSLHIPYAILAGFALSSIEEKINEKVKSRNFRNIIFFTIFIVLIFSTPIQYKFSLFNDGRLNEPFTGVLIRALNVTPSNSLIFVSQSASPDFDLVRTKERRWIDIDMIFANNGVWTKQEIENSKNKSIILIEDYRCMYSKDVACKFIYENFKLEQIANFTYKGTNAVVYNATYLG